MDAALAVLCDRCLGRRLVGARGAQLQRDAGAAARAEHGWPAEGACPVCEGAFSDFGAWVQAALDALAPYEFRSFQVGTVFPAPCEALEKRLMPLVAGENTESLRTEANRLLSAELSARTGAAPVPDGRPDVAVLVDTRFWTAEVRANSVFVAGRYTKLRRDLPQTHWPCKRCEGRGCWECQGAGVMYVTSVEDELAGPARAAFQAGGQSFHGAGREDIDARMLGTGRPFILELHAPRRRSADLVLLEAAINAHTPDTGVGVQDLRMAQREEVAAIKAADHDKEYVAHCAAAAPVPRAAVEDAARALTGAQLEQRTPERVSHRRADLVRKRRVHSVAVEAMAAEPSERFSLRIRAAGGTYIKEFVSGDEGRTQPSFSAVLGIPARVEALDVVAIHDKPGGAA